MEGQTGVCVYVERLGCGCGELRHVEQEVGVCWEPGWRDGEVGKETGLFGCVCVGRDMVWVFVGVYVCWRNWGLCVCVCMFRETGEYGDSETGVRVYVCV